MQICKLKIINFRGIQDLELDLPKHAVLMGANNAGKSTIAEAIALLCMRERMVKAISDWDFYGGSPQPDSRFKIIATISQFSNTKPTDPTMFPDWFLGERSATPIWWNDKTGILNFDQDPPPGTQIAAQIALAGRYDDELCEFELHRYFYRGEDDPFTDGCDLVPIKILRELGVFILSSSREWDKLLSFGSSTFLKAVKENNAIPGQGIEKLKQQLRNETEKIEEGEKLARILKNASEELKSFTLIGEDSELVYRPTTLDTLAILHSLIAHLQSEDSIIPVSRQGSGVISIQAFLLLLAFAELRKKEGKNFILIAEEPELHLHPSLHNKLAQRIKSSSVQSLVTTQSHDVAATYQPHQVVFIRKFKNKTRAGHLHRGPIKSIKSNSVKKLYLRFRPDFYEALMGHIVLIPEGEYDYSWLKLWLRVAEASSIVMEEFTLRPVSLIPTQNSAVIETYQEIIDVRPDAIPFIDGDETGGRYQNQLMILSNPPSKIIRLGKDAAVECLSAYFLEPLLKSATASIEQLIPNEDDRNLKNLERALIEEKKNRALHEELAWDTVNIADCSARIGGFWEDLSNIGFGKRTLLSDWTTDTGQSSIIFTADFIQKH